MAKRIFQGVVLFFAIYAFVFVPLGKKTALEHIQAIIGTPAAQDAAEEVKGGVTRLVRRLQDEARESTKEADRRRDEREPSDDDLSPIQPLPKPKLRALSAEKAASAAR
jgi:hypothetical protein